MENAKSAPTGCFKCGRPGHWSRDCPSSSSSAPSNSNFSFNSNINNNSNNKKTSGGVSVSKSAAQEKPKKVPRTKPKLTPDLLLSDDGLGFVLRHFPRAFKYRGRGHEVSDLGNLIGLYSEWHSHLIPYYSFDQFIHKVEQVSATKRVKLCIRDLRGRVASGWDPTKLHEALVELDGQTVEQAPAEAMSFEEQLHHHGDLLSNVHAADDNGDPLSNVHAADDNGDPSSNVHAADDIGDPSSSIHAADDIGDPTSNVHAADDIEDPSSNVHVADGIHEDLLHEIYKEATECDVGSRSGKVSQNEVPKNGGNCSNEVDITEEQRARMEANRLKALEKAAARAQQSQAS